MVSTRAMTDRHGAPRPAALMRTLVILALFAALLRAAIPAGYMLGADADSGAIAITICSEDDGHRAAFYDAATGEIVHQGDAPATAGDDGPCPFAAFAQGFAAPDTAPAPVIAVVYALRRDRPADFASFVAQAAAAPPPSRGPPLHV